MIWVLEGPDGVGKSTLANEIAKQKDAHIIHCSFKKSWDIKAYHSKIMQHAIALNKSGINVVLDRWAPSEQVYGDVFRGGPKYGVITLIKHLKNEDMVWIYCKNADVVKNHLENSKRRYEMFDSMEKVVLGFDTFVEETPSLNWNIYDFNKTTKEEFVGGLK